MKEFKKGPRRGSYNPIGFKKAPHGGFKGGKPGFKGAPRDKSLPLEMHQATCVRCKKFCEVPFKPNGKKPVYCRDCFAIQESDPSARAHASRQSSYPERTIVHTSVAPRQDDLKSQIEALNIKIDTLTRMIAELAAR